MLAKFVAGLGLSQRVVVCRCLGVIASARNWKGDGDSDAEVGLRRRGCWHCGAMVVLALLGIFFYFRTLIWNSERQPSSLQDGFTGLVHLHLHRCALPQEKLRRG